MLELNDEDGLLVVVVVAIIIVVIHSPASHRPPFPCFPRTSLRIIKIMNTLSPVYFNQTTAT